MVTVRWIFRIIRDYGEDKFAKNIAKHIVMARENKVLLKQPGSWQRLSDSLYR